MTVSVGMVLLCIFGSLVRLFHLMAIVHNWAVHAKYLGLASRLGVAYVSRAYLADPVCNV